MVVTTPAWADGGAPPSRSQVGFKDNRPAVDETDGALLRACRAGDDRAWDDLVDRYERLVFAVALRNGLQRDDAADVTQEVFAALLDALDSVKDEDALASWLMTVARRTSWQMQESNRRARRTPAGTEPVPQDDPFEAWTELSVLHDAVSRIEEPCRTLIRQLYLNGDPTSYAELAVRMGRSIGGIGPLRGRCLERLRAMVEDDLP